MKFQYLTSEERRLVRKQYGKDNLFKMLYKALSVYGGNSFSPEDIWHEATRVLIQIGEADKDAWDIEVQALFSDLPEYYGEGKETEVMCVMLTVFFMLLDKHDSIEGHPYIEVCCEIKSSLNQMRGFHELYEQCRAEEDKLEASGKLIEVVDYLEFLLSECYVSHVVDKDSDMEGMVRIVCEAKHFEVPEMRMVETLLSRINDKSNHRFQSLLNQLRQDIDEKVGVQHFPSTVNTQGGPLIMHSEVKEGVNFYANKQLE